VSGTGPFRFVETMGNGDVKFDRNADHWRSIPQVEAIILKKYADHSAVMAALLDGTLDAVMGSGVLLPADLKAIQTRQAAEFQVFLGPPIMNRIIIMNANKAPTDDLTLRKVIMHSVNKAAIIDKELAGLANPVDALFPKNAPFCNIDLTPRWDYDFEKAQLLRCPASVAAATTVTSSDDGDSDGIDTVLVIVIVAILVVVGLLAAVILYVFGKRRGAMEQKLLQSKNQVGGVVGKPDDTAA